MSVQPCPAPKCRGVDGNAVLTDQPMCEFHTSRVLGVLADLPRLYGELADTMLPNQHGGGERVATTSSRPLPINTDARAAQEDIAQLLRGAEVRYRLSRGWRLTPRLSESQTVVTLSSWAARHLTGILALDPAIGVALLTFRNRTRTLLGDYRLVHHLGAPCPTCEAPFLVRDDGDDYVVCRACGVAFPEEDYAPLTVALAAELTAPARPARLGLAAGAEGFGW